VFTARYGLNVYIRLILVHQGLQERYREERTRDRAEQMIRNLSFGLTVLTGIRSRTQQLSGEGSTAI
jgi:hypothetical protein